MNQLPKANLIADVFGAVSYLPELDRVMTKALSTLPLRERIFWVIFSFGKLGPFAGRIALALGVPAGIDILG